MYNRPTGKNTKSSTWFPACKGNRRPICADGSKPKPRFNTCSLAEMKCPKGKGFGPHDKPFTPCADGSKCKCPGGGKGCQFRYRRCDNGQKCRKRCNSGVPHCPWFTKNRNPHNGTRIYNIGPERPGNKEGGHMWPGGNRRCRKLLEPLPGQFHCEKIKRGKRNFHYLCDVCCGLIWVHDRCFAECRKYGCS